MRLLYQRHHHRPLWFLWRRTCLLVGGRVILLVLIIISSSEHASAFVAMPPNTRGCIGIPSSIATPTSSSSSSSSLFVSIGLGPEKEEQKAQNDSSAQDDDPPLVAGVDYEIPNHEEYRTSRRSKLDEACDQWFEALLESEVCVDNSNNNNNSKIGILGSLAEDARTVLMTPVELVNDVELPRENGNNEEWTPYVSTRLPWVPLTPSYGLEQFGLPVPRRNAETWRNFDVSGMIAQDYSSSKSDTTGTVLDKLPKETVKTYTSRLQEAGAWLGDSACLARLVYINGRFVPQLSKEVKEVAYNMDSINSSSNNNDEEIKSYLSRLTDGFTDQLATPVSNGPNNLQTSFSKLSGPNHNVGSATSQFAINSQQGTACFAALNTIKTGAVAYVHAVADATAGDIDNNDEEDENIPKPIVLIVNAVTPDGGVRIQKSGSDNDDANNQKGIACHPRTLVVAEEYARLSVVQSCVDLEDNVESTSSNIHHRPKLYNGYTQFFLKKGANVTHSYLEETGGVVTPGVELSDEEVMRLQQQQGSLLRPREMEAQRPQLKDTHLEAIDVQVMGEKAAYQGTVLSVGGAGRVRLAMSVTLLQPQAEAYVNGFCLSGGTQRTDMKTNIHHIAQGTTSRQVQKNMIGGRATGAFRGRIRVEQSAQQTDSQQLSRSVLLSDKARAWAIPSLEIIADDVKCSHGSTVSDLSEEELFYLRSRGLGRSMARNLLMYAFAGDVCSCVDPAMLGSVDSSQGLQKRLIRKLENLVPQGERKVKGEFQSS